MFDPQTNKFPYPVETDKHYLQVKKDRGLVFDTDYPYVDRSPKFRFKQQLMRIALTVLVFPVVRVRLGLRVNGRENLKKHMDEIKNGILSCCNHVHMWDYLAIMSAITPIRPNVLTWGPNINGENGPVMRLVGAIPIPETGLAATRKYLNSVSDLLGSGEWLHVYPEGSMWEYYEPIRPFKRGTAFIACDNDKPILPLAFSYREPGWLRKKIFRQIACFTLNIGEPLYKNAELSKKEQTDDLTRRSHDEVCRLAGIDPEKNLYGPLHDKGSRRIDYYTTEYGIGYKGSW